MQKIWIEILNPTENNKGKYTLEMFDGQETHKRFLDLSGQGTVVYAYTSNLTQMSHPGGDYAFRKGKKSFHCQYLSNILK